MSIGIWAQAPQGIPYQAVVRNADGTVMSNAAITLTFKIHDVTAVGAVVYEETHAVTSNSQGLVSMDVGSGTVVTGAFDNINWGGGNKFLHVLMNAGIYQPKGDGSICLYFFQSLFKLRHTV